MMCPLGLGLWAYVWAAHFAPPYGTTGSLSSAGGCDGGGWSNKRWRGGPVMPARRSPMRKSACGESSSSSSACTQVMRAQAAGGGAVAIHVGSLPAGPAKSGQQVAAAAAADGRMLSLVSRPLQVPSTGLCKGGTLGQLRMVLRSRLRRQIQQHMWQLRHAPLQHCAGSCGAGRPRAFEAPLC